MSDLNIINKFKFKLVAILLLNTFLLNNNNFALADNDENNIYKQLNMFGEVYERVRREYVEEVTTAYQ